MIGFIVLISYLIGSIPFGFIFTKLFINMDIRKYGSGNIGATNVFRIGGRLIGALTLLCDLLKGFIIVWAVSKSETYHQSAALCGMLCVTGHVFPIWLKFKGGKGVATMLGVLFGVSSLIGFVSFMVWLSIFQLTRIVSVASMASIGLSGLIYTLYGEEYWSTYIFICTALIIYRHKENIIRLYNGEEKGFTKT